jgi:hypothetical protein
VRCGRAGAGAGGLHAGERRVELQILARARRSEALERARQLALARDLLVQRHDLVEGAGLGQAIEQRAAPAALRRSEDRQRPPGVAWRRRGLGRRRADQQRIPSDLGLLVVLPFVFFGPEPGVGRALVSHGNPFGMKIDPCLGEGMSRD